MVTRAFAGESGLTLVPACSIVRSPQTARSAPTVNRTPPIGMTTCGEAITCGTIQFTTRPATTKGVEDGRHPDDGGMLREDSWSGPCRCLPARRSKTFTSHGCGAVLSRADANHILDGQQADILVSGTPTADARLDDPRERAAKRSSSTTSILIFGRSRRRIPRHGTSPRDLRPRSPSHRRSSGSRFPRGSEHPARLEAVSGGDRLNFLHGFPPSPTSLQRAVVPLTQMATRVVRAAEPQQLDAPGVEYGGEQQ